MIKTIQYQVSFFYLGVAIVHFCKLFYFEETVQNQYKLVKCYNSEPSDNTVNLAIFVFTGTLFVFRWTLICK